MKYLRIRRGNTDISSSPIPLHGEHFSGAISDGEGECVRLRLTAIMEIAHFVVVDVSHCEAGDPLVTLGNRHLERAMNGRPHDTEQQMSLLKQTIQHITHGDSS